MFIFYLKSKGKLGNFDVFFLKREKNVCVLFILKVNICYFKLVVNEFYKFILCYSLFQELMIERQRQVFVLIRLYMMFDLDLVGEYLDKKVNQVIDFQGLLGDEVGGVEDVVEWG